MTPSLLKFSFLSRLSFPYAKGVCPNLFGVFKLAPFSKRYITKYLSPEFQRSVEAATSSADKSSVTISTSSNPYNSVFKNIRRKDSTAKNIYRVANSYMANFSLFEYGTFRNALYSLVNNGDMSKTEATKMIAGVTARMSSYMVMYTLLTQLMDEELLDDRTPLQSPVTRNGNINGYKIYEALDYDKYSTILKLRLLCKE